MDSKNEYLKVNTILSKWNPIGVPDYIANDEYSSYVKRLSRFKNDFLGLVNSLEYILTEEIELNYDFFDNLDDKKEVLYYAYKIYEVINKETQASN